MIPIVSSVHSTAPDPPPILDSIANAPIVRWVFLHRHNIIDAKGNGDPAARRTPKRSISAAIVRTLGGRGCPT